MLFLFTGTFKTHLTRDQQDAALARRSQWSYPEGTSVRAEYWTVNGQVISVYEADSYEAVWTLTAAWQDVFDITVTPAVSAEEGLRIGPKVLASRPA